MLARFGCGSLSLNCEPRLLILTLLPYCHTPTPVTQSCVAAPDGAHAPGEGVGRGAEGGLQCDRGGGGRAPL